MTSKKMQQYKFCRKYHFGVKHETDKNKRATILDPKQNRKTVYF